MTGLPTYEELSEKLEAEFDNYVCGEIANGREPNTKKVKEFAEAQKAVEWDMVSMSQGAAKKRGRPPVPKYKYKAAIADVNIDDLNAWRIKIRKSVKQEVPTLTAEQLTNIADRLTEVARHYRYGKQLRANQKTITNKQHIEKPVLIRDCAKAWEEITGETITIWYAQSSNPNSNGIIEPAIFKIARIVAQAATGKPLVGDLREHGKKATEIIEKEREISN